MKNKKKIWIFTLFPNYFTTFLSEGVIARCKSQFDIELVNIRDFSLNNYKSVDDSPYGGGPGMVMRADVCFEALKKVVLEPMGLDPLTWSATTHSSPQIYYACAAGTLWNATHAKSFAAKLCDENTIDTPLVFWCGRYEGIDERFLQRFVHQRFSIGDYVLSGGELAVQVLLDSALRFVEGILGNAKSHEQDSFEDSLLDAPCYTRPKTFMGVDVPEVLTKGHHAEIQKFQKEQGLLKTKKFRPDMVSDILEDQ